MAIVFELWVECESREEAKKHIPHFDGLTFTLFSGLEVSWNSSIEEMSPGTPGLSVSASRLNNWGICTVQDAVDASECGIRLYHHLLTAPDFNFAYTAWNPTISAAELEDWFSVSTDGHRHCSLSCVLSERLAQKFLPLRGFQPFRPGYVWHTYYGERYSPLGSHDHPELLQLKRQLLTD